MAQILYTDAIKTELAQAVLTTVQTQIDVVSVAQMPTVTAGDWFYLTLYDNDLGDYEIVKVTDITGTVLTVERGVGNKPSLTFGIAETSVIKWIVGLDWEDLRTELQTYCATAEDLSNAIIGFLVQSQVQVLINESLEPYITIAGADLLISSFLTEAQISSLINQNLTGYTTTAEATSIAEQVFSDEVTARQLQTQSQVQTLIDAAIASVNFLSAVSITDGGETVGILSGSGTSGDPLQINWGASDPANLLDIPTNTAHTSSTDNPHNVTAAQVNCLALDNVTVFSPTADYHPATKKYVDDEVAGIANTPTIDTTDVGSDNGRIILGVDKDNAQIKYLRCWQKTSINTSGQGPYTVTFPTNNILDHAPKDIQAIVDVSLLTAGQRLSAGISLYVAERTTTQATIIMDLANGATGVSGNNLEVILTYEGKKTIP